MREIPIRHTDNIFALVDIHIGYFDDENEAALAWNKVAFEAWGEYAYQNEVE